MNHAKKHQSISLTHRLEAIFSSSIFTDIRGSIGGTTYARNKSGAYARNRTFPVNPNTENQSLVRSRLSTLAEAFSNLTAPQVNSWNQFAQGYPAKNRIGESYTPTGKQVYMLCNLNLMSIGLPAISAPPYDTPVVPGLNTESVVVTLTKSPSGVHLNAFTIAGLTSDQDDAVVVVQATPNMQAARQSYRNRMRQVGFDTQDTTIDIEDAWKAYFGDPLVVDDQIVNLRASAVDIQSGVASAWFYFQGIIVDSA